MSTMTARKVGGAIRRAKYVMLRVTYNDSIALYVEVPKSVARIVVEDAKDHDPPVMIEAKARGDGSFWIG